jgi:putative ABC transport system permease protein
MIRRGRAPAASSEIALGSRTMADAGVDLGDSVELNYLESPHRLTVVGEAVINDGHEPIPGLGAIVTPQWLASVDNASYVSDFAIRFSPEARRDGVAAVEKEFSGWTTRSVAPHGVVNLERISGWPAVLAVLMATLAVVAFLHALVLTVRTQRRQLAVLRALGSSRRQLAAAVIWHAVFLTVPAVAVGVPLGVVLGRAGWGVFARNLGVGSGPIVPPVSLVLAAVVTLAVTAILAVGPSWSAAQVGTTEALRAE